MYRGCLHREQGRGHSKVKPVMAFYGYHNRAWLFGCKTKQILGKKSWKSSVYFLPTCSRAGEKPVSAQFGVVFFQLSFMFYFRGTFANEAKKLFLERKKLCVLKKVAMEASQNDRHFYPHRTAQKRVFGTSITKPGAH